MTQDQENQELSVEIGASARMSAQDLFMWGMNNVDFNRDVPQEAIVINAITRQED